MSFQSSTFNKRRKLQVTNKNPITVNRNTITSTSYFEEEETELKDGDLTIHKNGNLFNKNLNCDGNSLNNKEEEKSQQGLQSCLQNSLQQEMIQLSTLQTLQKLDIDCIEEILSFCIVGYCNLHLLRYFRQKRKVYKNLTFLKECFGKKNNKIINLFKHWKINENLSIRNFIEKQTVNPFTKSLSLKINDFATFDFIVNNTTKFLRLTSLHAQEVCPLFNFKLLNREKFPKLEKLIMAANDESYDDFEIISGLKTVKFQNITIFANYFQKTRDVNSLLNFYGNLQSVCLLHAVYEDRCIQLMNLYCPQLKDVTLFTNKEICGPGLEKLLDHVKSFCFVHMHQDVAFLNEFIYKNRKNLYKIKEIKISSLIYGNQLPQMRFISPLVTEMFLFEVKKDSLRELQHFTKLKALKITNCHSMKGFASFPASLTTINFDSAPPFKHHAELKQLQNLSTIIFENPPDLANFLVNTPFIQKLILHNCTKKNLEDLENCNANNYLRKVELTFSDCDAEFVDLDILLMKKNITKIKINCNIRLESGDTQSNIPNGFPDVTSLLVEDTSHLESLQCLISAYYEED